MDHAILVEMDVAAGARVVKTLDDRRLEPSVALLATFAEYFAPRLVIAAEWLDETDQTKRFQTFSNLITDTDFDSFSVPVQLLEMNDPFILDLRQEFRASSRIEGRRLGGRYYGGRYLEDGYVYRIR